MARHPTARRAQPAASTDDDAFIERVLESTAWAKTHQRVILWGGVVLLILVGSVLWYRNYRATLETNAAVQLTTVRQTVSSGNHALAVRDLERYLEQYGSTASAAEARLMLAQEYLATNQPQQAIEAVREQAQDLSDPLGPPAAFLLAAGLESVNQFDRAETVLLRLAESAPLMSQKESALDALARNRMERGDAAGAAQAYNQLLELLPENSPGRPVFEMRRAEAQARATAG